jgi:hypothetical protein
VSLKILLTHEKQDNKTQKFKRLSKALKKNTVNQRKKIRRKAHVVRVASLAAHVKMIRTKVNATQVVSLQIAITVGYINPAIIAIKAACLSACQCAINHAINRVTNHAILAHLSVKKWLKSESPYKSLQKSLCRQ